MSWTKIAGIVTVLALAAVVVLKLRTNKEIAESNVYQYDKEKAVSITADTLQLGNANTDITFIGTFEPNKETKISAELTGKINRYLVDEGNQVKKGQTLIQLDNSLLHLQLRTVEVEIEALEKDVARYTVLVEADAIQGIQLEKAQVGLRKALVQKATILEQISKTTIEAPFDGVITAKLNEEGGFAAPGIPLLQLTDIQTVRFTIQVPENDLKLFSTNGKYAIKADVLPEDEFGGKLLMIGSKANKGNSFPIQFSVQNTPGKAIKSGMFGKAILNNELNRREITIPSSALVGSAEKPQVYLVKSGKAVLQRITISRRIGNKVTVSSGLNNGDVLVTNGFVNLYENANVSVKQISEQ